MASASAASSKVILEAKVLSYDQLPVTERDELNKYGCCQYSKNGGWTSSDTLYFDSENAYFVQTKIDSSALAHLLLLNSCSGESYWRKCSPSRLEEKVKELFDNGNPYGFYGKYMNRWAFSSENGVVPATAKFTGHNILALNQDGNSAEHNLIIGPLPERPTRMRIQPYNSLEKDDKGSVELELDLTANGVS